jgi:NAD-dependent dihydropyrimidine dehydrogenase PreA subunit
LADGIGKTMGHTAGERVYRSLGNKIDSLQTRAPWNDAFHEILKTLYTPEQADLVTKMPYGLANLDEIEKVTKYERTKLKSTLESLCSQGLVMDLWMRDEYRYMPSPMVVGIFELVMMRTGGELDSKRWAEIFHQYLHGDDAFYAANFGRGEKVSVMRTLVHEEAVLPEEYVEVLDYEKATAIVNESDRFAVGLCSCRHEKSQLDRKECDMPLDVCSFFGAVADLSIRNGFAKEISKSQILENLARSKELKLVLTADNVKKKVNFMCHCCKCCCNIMLGVTKHGCPNTIVTSSFISKVNRASCKGCGKCVDICPVNAIEAIPDEKPQRKTKKTITIDEALCIGCGVCGLECASNGIGLIKRKQHVMRPETTFERVILQCLERGTLQNQMFANPQSLTHKFMRGFVGGFLRLPPVKKALMSDLLRSSFLATMKMGIRMQGKGWLLEM